MVAASCRLAGQSAGAPFAAIERANERRQCHRDLRRFGAGIGIGRFPDQCTDTGSVFASAYGSRYHYDRRSNESSRDSGSATINVPDMRNRVIEREESPAFHF